MQIQDFINLKTHIINLIISRSNKTQIPQIKQNAIIVSNIFSGGNKSNAIGATAPVNIAICTVLCLFVFCEIQSQIGSPIKPPISNEERITPIKSASPNVYDTKKTNRP